MSGIQMNPDFGRPIFSCALYRKCIATEKKETNRLDSPTFTESSAQCLDYNINNNNKNQCLLKRQ